MKVTRSFEAPDSNGMDIVNFFETVEGTWFSQRTTHFAPGQPSQTGQTTLQITRVELDDARVLELCQQFSIEATAAIFAFVIQPAGKTSLYSSENSPPSSTTMMVGCQSEDDASGQFLSQTEQETAVSGKYQLEDEILTLSVHNDDFESEERLWYMNPNLRMRTSLVKRADGFRMSSFCSEVRRLST